MKYPADKPCPRPGEMIVVKTKRGSFWRMKRAKGTPINDRMKGANTMLKTLSPAAARFVGELRPYMLNMDPGMINLRVKSCLQNSIKEKGSLDYKYMDDLDFQPDYPLWKLMKHIPRLTKDGNDVVLYIAIPEGGAAKALNTYISGYRFSLIMIVGDVVKGDVLQTFAVSSPRYKTGIAVEEGCELRMVKPDEGEKWVCIIRITSYEGKSLPSNPRHYGMKVVGWDSKQMLEGRGAEQEVEGVNDGVEGANGQHDNEVEGVNGRVEGVNGQRDKEVEGVNGRVEGERDDLARVINETVELTGAGARPDRREKIKAVAVAILKEPGMSAPEITLKTGLPLKSIQRHLRLLKDAGLIEYRGSAKKGGYYLSN